jgi:NADH-quinone oxidoreductase subunit G
MKIKLQIDGKTYETEPGVNLLETCLSLGFDLPYFCYHPAMGCVGACRQCAVKRYRDASDQKGRIIMSCMEPVTDGMIISISDPDAKAFRTSVTESLMLNHPHDCPVCDEGGECHLQDMTVMTGHNYRHTTFAKRTHQNQYLGPFLHHEMNRCIQCYRCVRFYKEYAGGRDFGVFGAHDHVYFGRFEEGVLENEFSGNLAEVCPTGVFTDKTLKKHYTRKWDLTNSPSVCIHCSVGCNTIVSERYGTLRRILSRYNGSVNGYFLCDRGRFGYEFTESDHRIRKPVLKTSLAEALAPGKPVIGIGSPRASLEANYALSALVGRERFFNGLPKKESDLVHLALRILRDGQAHSPSLKEIERADAVLILGEDVTNTAPMVALAVRQASRTVPAARAGNSGIPRWNDTALRDHIQDQKSPVIIASPFATQLDELAENVFRSTPDGIARLGFAVASRIDGRATDPGDKELDTLAQRIAEALGSAKNPIVITGTHMGHPALLEAAANVAWALSAKGVHAGLSILFPECNTLGIAMMEEKSIEEAGVLAEKQNVKTLVILENDLFRRMEQKSAERFLSGFTHVIVLDQVMTETAGKANMLFPVATFAESEGTLVNHEGRAQRFYRVLPDEKSGKESWRRISEWVAYINEEQGEAWETFDGLVRDMTAAHPVLSSIQAHMPDADYRMLHAKIRRQTSRFSGRTAMNAQLAVSEPKPPDDPDSPFAFSMEGADERPPSSLVPFYWNPGWNSNQSMNFYLDAPNGALKGGDPGIRLIEAKEGRKITFFTPPPQEETPGKDNWLLVPVYTLFGSEELSNLGPAIAERIPKKFIWMNSRDAGRTGKKQGESFSVRRGETSYEGILLINESMPDGVAGVPVLLPGMPYMELPGTGKT